MAEAENVNGNYISDLQLHVITKRGNKSEEIAGRIGLLGIVCKVSSRKTLSVETFCFPGKRLL